ncbi:MAG: NADP-dependent oxidoreductase [Pseudomonadota bacterium]
MAFNRTGGPDVFEWMELETPRPGPGEVLVQVVCAGVNPADWKNREGMLEVFRPYVFPCIIGFDAAGVVAAVGEGVNDLEPGERVVTPTNHGQGGQGSYAEFAVASRDRVARIPDGLDFAAAAVLPVAALTAWQGLFDRGGLQAADRVFIHGGSGGVGGFAVQFARWAGARVAASCGRSNCDYVRSLGVELVLDYATDDIAARLSEWSPDGVDYLMDAVGVSSLPQALSLVKQGGTLVSIPTLVDDGDPAAAIAAAEQRSVRRVFSTMNDQECAEALERIAALVAAGDIRLPRVIEHPLAEVAAVHSLVEQGRGGVKHVLRVSDLGP